MFCVKCGTEASSEEKICSNCGCLVSGTPEKRVISVPAKLTLGYFVGYMMLGVGIVSFLAIFYAMLKGIDISDSAAFEAGILNFTYVAQIFLDVTFLVIFIIIGKSVLTLEQFKDKSIPKTILLTLGLSVAFLAGNMLIGNLLALIPGAGESANQEAIAEMVKSAPLTIIISAVIFAPIVEELVFRAGVYKLFEGKFNTKIAILGSGAIFGLLHVVMGLMTGDLFELVYFINYFAMGCAFGLLYAKTKNIYICMGVHFINNLVGVLLLFLTL
ncbi:MAG: CPBP family glutamic-type intramembrane protease [bacterium]